MTVVQNQLMERLPDTDRQLLLAICEPVTLVLSEVLCDHGTPTEHVYFPTQGFISLVTQIEGHPGLEVGMIGREGMLGSHLALGILTEPLHALVQGAGEAWRADTGPFLSAMAHSLALQRLIKRYLYVRMSQSAASAACLRFHLIGPRLARWLLMSQDRAQSDRFRVTQEFLAYMLGVRRVGVTMAAGALQRSGLIKYHRGDLTVLDRPRLELAACGCYAADRRVYSDLLPEPDAVPAPLASVCIASS